MQIGKKYSYKGVSYPFHGEWTDDAVKKPGLYKHKGKIRLLKKEEKPVENELLNEILSNREASGIIKKHSLQDPVDIIKSTADSSQKGSGTDRISLNNILRYQVSPKDDQLVKIVKEQINLRNIKAKDIDYNMLYGLRVRNTMKYETFLKWCNILGVQMKITLV